MRKYVSLLAFLYVSTVYAAPVAYDESINFQPGINLYNESAKLTDLFGVNGNQLCAPNAITHAMNFLKLHRKPNFGSLMSVSDLDQDGRSNTYQDQIRYFFQACQTNPDVGTYVHQAIDCMDTFVSQSGYGSFTFMIGAHSKSSVPGHSNDQLKRAVTTNDLRYYLSNQAGVIMTVGWYKFNVNEQKYVRDGGHFFNLYGYDFDAAWGNEKIILKVVNSWINYTGRNSADMFDDVAMNKVTGPEFYYPANIQFELTGPGFTFTESKALVEDIFIIFPFEQ